MTSPALALAVALLSGPPSGERPPVQAPSVSPVQPQPGDPAIAPAHVDGVAAQPETMPAEQPPPADPVVASEPEPGPSEPGPSELPSWQSEAPPVSDPTFDPNGGVMVDDWGTPVEPPPKPRNKGAGLYAAAGALFGVMVTRQWITALTCEDVYCGWRGNFDRIMSLGVMGFSAGGGWLDNRYTLRDPQAPAKSLKPRRAIGWTAFAIGFGGLLADTVLYNLCYQQAKGPYTQLNGFSYTCSPVASVVILDFSTLFGGVGIGFGMSAERQLRERKKVNLSLSPYGGRGQAGLSLSGTF